MKFLFVEFIYFSYKERTSFLHIGYCSLIGISGKIFLLGLLIFILSNEYSWIRSQAVRKLSEQNNSAVLGRHK